MAKKSELEKQLDNLWNDKGSILTLESKRKKYAIMSDMHMGDGSKSDDFKKNELAVKRALIHYFNNNYSLILLGDVEELWQFSIKDIVKQYNKNIYSNIRKFGDKRVIRVFGNHDLEWQMQDPTKELRGQEPTSYEAIKLKDANGIAKLLLLHGHQGTVESDKYSWLSKAFVRFYGNKVEPYLKIDKHSSAPRSPIIKSYDKERYAWAKKRKLILICGHSHRAFFASKSKYEKLLQEMKDLKQQLKRAPSVKEIARLSTELLNKKQQIIDEQTLRGEYTSLDRKPAPHYFNTGCTLYSDGLTLIEIENDFIKLVKWHQKPKAGKQFEIYEQESLSECINNI